MEDSVRGLIKKWGNSVVVRVPAALLRTARICVDQLLDVRGEGGRIVIEALRTVRYDIDALVDGITNENRHDSVDMGKPVGREVW
jgi:antitoxin MazE